MRENDESSQARPDRSGRCRKLRSKLMYDSPEWEAHAAAFLSDSVSYWCLKTMGPAGPDEAPATLDDCRNGRGCFERGD